MKYLAPMLLSAFFTAAQANCFDRYGDKHGIEPDLLRAIALVESSGNPKATAGRGRFEDLGLMQINASWLSKLNLSRSDLLENVCLNVETGARILKDNFARFENPWEAVGAYNAGCSKLKGQACTDARQKYAWKVYRAMQSLTPNKVERLNRIAS